MIPSADNSHITIATITTIFKIVLMGAAIGIYVLMSQSRKPETTKTTTIVIRGILYSLKKLSDRS